MRDGCHGPPPTHGEKVQLHEANWEPRFPKGRPGVTEASPNTTFKMATETKWGRGRCHITKWWRGRAASRAALHGAAHLRPPGRHFFFVRVSSSRRCRPTFGPRRGSGLATFFGPILPRLESWQAFSHSVDAYDLNRHTGLHGSARSFNPILYIQEDHTHAKQWKVCCDVVTHINRHPDMPYRRIPKRWTALCQRRNH